MNIRSEDIARFLDPNGVLRVPVGYTRITGSPIAQNDIKGVVLPEGFQAIGDNVFTCCGEIAFVHLPCSLLQIGSHAFSSCASLKSISIPGSVSDIEECAFGSCIRLEDVHIAEGVRRIRKNAFAGCCMLKRVILPASIECIAQDAFENTESIYGKMDFTILSPKGSYAEAFAGSQGFRHERLA